MSGIDLVEGPAVGMAAPNIDTDQIIPARYLLRPRGAGYGDLLFRDGRCDATGAPLAGHVLNTPEGKTARILVAGRNFGCGSAREQAAYALRDFGIRAVVAPSFGEIFRLNCVRNGIVPAIVPEVAAAALRDWLADGARPVRVDLRARRVDSEALSTAFEIEEVNAERLLSGRDEIDETLSRFADRIAAFEQRQG